MKKIISIIIGIVGNGARLIKNGTVSASQSAYKWSAAHKFWTGFIAVHMAVFMAKIWLR